MLGCPPFLRGSAVVILIALTLSMPASAYQTEIKTSAGKVEIEIDSAAVCLQQTSWELTSGATGAESSKGVGRLSQLLPMQEVTLKVYSPCDGYCNYSTGQVICHFLDPVDGSTVAPTPLPLAPTRANASGLSY